MYFELYLNVKNEYELNWKKIMRLDDCLNKKAVNAMVLKKAHPK